MTTYPPFTPEQIEETERFAFKNGKTASRRSFRNSIKSFDQAAAFRFLRQPSRPSAPRPMAKSGSAPGRGTTCTVPLRPK